MIYPSADKLENWGNKYALATLAAKRAKQIKSGAPALVDTDSRNPLTIALEEIASGKITCEVPDVDALPQSAVEPEVAQLLSLPMEPDEEAEELIAGVTSTQTDHEEEAASVENEEEEGEHEDWEEEEEEEEEEDLLSPLEIDEEEEAVPATDLLGVDEESADEDEESSDEPVADIDDVDVDAIDEGADETETEDEEG